MKQYLRSDIDLNNASVRELRKAQQAWKVKFDARDAEYQTQRNAYEEAVSVWTISLEELVKDQLSEYFEKMPTLYMSAEARYKRIDVNFRYEERDNALRWSYSISCFDDGTVEKTSNSWSGIEVVTIEQAEDLLNSANLLKAIVSLDWQVLFAEARSVRPTTGEYITVEDPRYDKEYRDPGYDKLIEEAEKRKITSDIIGKDIWVVVKDYRSEYANNWRGYTLRWTKIVSQTPKFYILKRYIDGTWTERVSKDKIEFYRPLEFVSEEEYKAMGEPNRYQSGTAY